jgi:hypothetical protein
MAKKSDKYHGGNGSRAPEQMEGLYPGFGAIEPDAIRQLPACLAGLSAARAPKLELAGLSAVATGQTLGRRRNGPRCPQ